MNNQDNEDLKRIAVYVPKEVAEKFQSICEKIYDSKKAGNRPLKEFIHNFIRENSKPPKIK